MLSPKLKNIIRPDIQAMSAYTVAQLPPDCVKLDAMESPYHYTPEMQQELSAQLAQAPIERYPHIENHPFIEQLKKAHHIPDHSDIVLGNGSDELIQIITQLIAQPQAKILGIEPTFVMYRHNAALYKTQYISVNTNPDFSLNLETTLATIKEQQPTLIWLSYPNNPTGTRYPRAAIEAIIQAAPGLIVIDEAYGAFSSDSFLSQAGQPENLLILRTFSKIGYAGLRLGYLTGSPQLIKEIKKITPPYNMNQLSLKAAQYALSQQTWTHNNINRLKAEREILHSALEDIEAISVYPSEANFLTLRVPNAQTCFDHLKANGYLIKNLHGSHPLLEQCIRITIGLPEDNQQIINLLNQHYG